jgi:hypothetical protein
MDAAPAGRALRLAACTLLAASWVATVLPRAAGQEPPLADEIVTPDGRRLQFTFDADEPLPDERAGGLPYVLAPDGAWPLDGGEEALAVEDAAAFDPYADRAFAPPLDAPQLRTWQLLPTGLLYPSYLAGVQEPRFGATILHEDEFGSLLDATLGARVGVLRFGTAGPRGEGFQVDAEGAAFPRLDLENDRDLVSVDFRAGLPLTWREGPFETKLAYYHTSSHLGDEFLERVPGATRINYVRDSIVLGSALRLAEAWRVYAEVGYAFHTSGGAEPWEFQFGAEYSPLWADGPWGSPFLAANALLREEVDFGGQFVLQAGWQWRAWRTGHVLRAGFHYLNGKSSQQQFFADHEQQIGGGVWFDY